LHDCHGHFILGTVLQLLYAALCEIIVKELISLLSVKLLVNFLSILFQVFLFQHEVGVKGFLINTLFHFCEFFLILCYFFN